MAITSKLGTVVRYVSSPSRYPFLIRLIKTRLFGGAMDLNRTSDQASHWCREHCVDTHSALRQLGYTTACPTEEFPDVFAESRRVVAACPQSMGGAGNLSLLYSLVLGSAALKIVETGVAYGWSSLAILLAISSQGDAHLFSSNLHYPKFDGDERFVGCAVPQGLRAKWTLISAADSEAVPRILNLAGRVDLVHYDSAKSYAGRMETYPILWNALRVGGLFVSDDIDDNIGFMHFCKMLRCHPIVVETPQAFGRTKYVGVLRKTDDRTPRAIMF